MTEEVIGSAACRSDLIDELTELIRPLRKYNGASVLMAVLGYDVDADCLRGWIREADKSGNHADARRTKAILQLNDAIQGYLDAELLEDAEEEVSK